MKCVFREACRRLAVLPNFLQVFWPVEEQLPFPYSEREGAIRTDLEIGDFYQGVEEAMLPLSFQPEV